MSDKNIFRLFRRGDLSYGGEAVVSNPDRLSGAESELQLNLLSLNLTFALGSQHSNTKAGDSHRRGHPGAGLLPALTLNTLTCN